MNRHSLNRSGRPGRLTLLALFLVLVTAPAASADDTGYLQVSAGGLHTCALRLDGAAICWGGDSYGQSTPPAGVFTQISAGSVALAGIAASLSLDPDCEVLSHAWPITRKELHCLAPEVVLFDLNAVPPSFVYTVSSELPGALLIGIDLETNRALLWTEREAEGLSSQYLAQIIHHKGEPL